MLNLSRRINERIKIEIDLDTLRSLAETANHNGHVLITVEVLEIHTNQVKLGVDAPREIAVHREEIYMRVLKERDERKVLAALEAERGIE